MPAEEDPGGRYARQIALRGFGPEAQERLLRGSVLVVGAGGLSCPALLYLAAAGVGRITLLDPDRVELSNLQRQVLYEEADVGAPKAGAAAARLRRLNSDVHIEARCDRFNRSNALGLVAGADVVIDGSDNFATRYLVNDACVISGKPFVYGAIQGFEGQLSVFNWKGGPTYRCLFPEAPDPGSMPSCAEAGVLGVLPGLVGTAQACEAIKVLTGVGDPLSGRVLIWDALGQQVRMIRLEPTPGCRDIRELPADDQGAVCGTESRSEEIAAAELRQALSRGEKVQLVDVREDWERARGAIQPSVHLPLRALESAPGGSLPGLDRNAFTVVYCAAGVRSLRAARILRQRHAFVRVRSLAGGMGRWAESE